VDILSKKRQTRLHGTLSSAVALLSLFFAFFCTNVCLVSSFLSISHTQRTTQQKSAPTSQQAPARPYTPSHPASKRPHPASHRPTLPLLPAQSYPSSHRRPQNSHPSECSQAQRSPSLLLHLPSHVRSLLRLLLTLLLCWYLQLLMRLLKLWM
jgi:hypothetical protein